jgi:cellulose synthase/poly-beta-1,6-N-acetylglucosamine synthase-like glycosyltransferase
MDEGIKMYLLPVILILPYFFLIISVFRNLLGAKSFTGKATPGVKISVIVACRNEQHNLPHILESIAAQDYPHKLFEVIVADDNSTDMTAAVAESFSVKLNLKTVRNQGSGKKMAIRTGVGESSGNLIITTDADCMMGKGWISGIASFYETHKPDLIVCPVKLGHAPGFFGKFQELEFLSLQAITAGTVISGNGTMCNGASLAFTKAAYYINLPGLRFDIATGDDVFLLHSMKKKEAKIMWLESPATIVETQASSDISSFFRQRKRWASKAAAYKDGFSVFLGIVTFVTILIQAVTGIGAFFEQRMLITFIYIFLIKSIADFPVLLITTRRYGRGNLMWWFVPCQVIYPFYVMAVAGYTFFTRKKTAIRKTIKFS